MVTHADHAQLGPVSFAGKFGIYQNRVDTLFLPAMSSLYRFMTIMLDAGEIVFTAF